MPIHYRPDELPLIGAITAGDIRDEVKEIGEFYPEKDEVALIKAAVLSYDLDFKVDVLKEDEPVFDKVEKLLTEIPRALRDYQKEDNRSDEATIIIYQKKVNDKLLGNLILGTEGAASYATTYKPLIEAFQAYESDWNLRFSSLSVSGSGNEGEDVSTVLGKPLPPLSAVTYKDPWDEIDSFEPQIKCYTEAEKQEKIDYCIKGLRDNTQPVRDSYLDKSRKLKQELKKLEFQANNVDAWTMELEKRKDEYLICLFEEALLLDCNSKLKRLAKKVY